MQTVTTIGLDIATCAIKSLRTSGGGTPFPKRRSASHATSGKGAVGCAWQRRGNTLKIELERMRIDVVGRHYGADQGIGENVREGEAVRAFLTSAAGERIHRFLSCRDRDFKFLIALPIGNTA
jgi:hypothetical protein